jgi:hypothetical protein
MATKAKFGTKKALKDAKAASKTAFAGGSASAGTHTAKLVQKAIKKLTGKTMKPVKTAVESLKIPTGKLARMKNNNPERFHRIMGERSFQADVAELVRRETRAGKLLKARAAKRK